MIEKRPQFRLASLMVAMFVVALLVAWFVTARQSAQRIENLEIRNRELEVKIEVFEKQRKSSLKTALANAEADLVSLRARFAENHPNIFAAKARIAILRKELQD